MSKQNQTQKIKHSYVGNHRLGFIENEYRIKVQSKEREEQKDSINIQLSRGESYYFL